MEHQQCEFGMIGLGVMGSNFLLNVADSGFTVVGYDKDPDKSQSLNDASEGRVDGVTTVEKFLERLASPRKIMLLVPAGPIVDAVIQELSEHLDPGDVIIDGGNSHFTDTNRRMEALEAKKIHFLGVGVSGGEEGARHGPSLMPGGNKEAYEIVRPMLEAAAAKVSGEPCVAYLGKKSAGHFVKMVHNGIEYGIMQLTAEVYDYLKRGMRLTNKDVQRLFAKWNEGELQSFLIEITAHIFTKEDAETGDGLLVDHILDKAKQKGTGKWTSQVAMDLGVPIPTIDVSVTMRFLSALKDQRVAAAEDLDLGDLEVDEQRLNNEEQLMHALYFAFVTAYAQGLALLQAASEEFDYGINLEDVARIWRGGCIIRASFLEDIMQAYREQPDLSNLILAPGIAKLMKERHTDARQVVRLGVEQGIPVPALASALTYFDAYRTERLPSNLTQAQRDYFGAHTYERIDQEGTFHTEWEDDPEVQDKRSEEPDVKKDAN